MTVCLQEAVVVPVTAQVMVIVPELYSVVQNETKVSCCPEGDDVGVRGREKRGCGDDDDDEGKVKRKHER